MWQALLMGAGSWAMDYFDDPKRDIKSHSLLSEEAREYQYRAAQGLLSQAESPYYGDKLSADIPDLAYESYDWFGGQFGSPDMNNALQALMRGTPAYTFKPGETTERWQESFATPIMDAWRSSVLPSIKEGFNVPGGAYSTAASRGTLQAGSDFYGQYVAPSLFTALQAGEQRGFESAEAAAGRRAGAVTLPGQIAGQGFNIAGAMQGFEQAPLSRQYQEFVRAQQAQLAAYQAVLNIPSEAVAFPFSAEQAGGDGGSGAALGGMAMGMEMFG